MRICFLGNVNGVHMQKWATHFYNLGYEVHVISVTPGKIEGCKCHSIRSRFKLSIIFSYLTLLRNINKLLSEINPEIVHVFYATYYGYIMARSTFHPYVISALGSDIYRDSKNPIYRRLLIRALKNADLITADSQRLAEQTKIIGGNDLRIIQLLFGVDTELFSPDNVSPSLLEETGFLKDSQIIISTRQLFLSYDIDCLIKAIPLVVEEEKTARFLIGGKGAHESHFKHLVKDMGISEYVHFYGHVPYEELPHYMNLAKIYISTSPSDSTSVSLLEAMSLGIVPVVSDVPDNLEWVQPNKNGMIFRKKDHVDLAKKIIEVLSNFDEKKHLASQNRQVVIKRASWKENTRLLLNWYEKIITEHSEADKESVVKTNKF